jgi:hypothetical protein
MTLRSLGFTHADFATLSLPELYLRFCIAHSRQKQDS